MSLSEKQVRGLVLAASLIMLIGGIIGAIYCAQEIKGLLNWAESQGDPRWSKQYKYQQYQVVEEVRSLSRWLGGSADIAVLGGLASLALLLRRRFQWKGVRGLAFSLLGAFIILLVILGVIYFSQRGAFGSGISGALIATLLFLVILFLLRKRLPMRESFFILGGFLMLVGVFGAIRAFVEANLEITQEFAILFWVITLISIGIAILGALFSLAALCWPRGKQIN